jgi:glycosyltransferase involved in cell wall biosynthesis
VTEFTVSKHTDEHSGIAFVCKVDDFTDRLEEIYDNYEKYRNLAGKLREEILERFNWDKILGNLVL